MFYRLKNAIGYRYFEFKTRALKSTPPTPCDPDAACEIHTMLGARDTPLYLAAIKSFLRYYGAVAVVVHSDGTLNRRVEATIGRHVPGCRFIPAAEADERARRALGHDPELLRFRGIDISYRRIFDSELWASTPRRIIMDSDILVLRPPREVIDWIERGDAPFLIGQPPAPEKPCLDPSAVGANVQTIFKSKLKEISRSLGYSDRFLDGTTGGFYGCSRELSAEKVGGLIRAAERAGVPMGRWGGEQCVVIYLLSVARAKRLDQDRYLNYGPQHEEKLRAADLVHFYGTHRFHKGIYPDAASRMIAELRRPNRPESQVA